MLLEEESPAYGDGSALTSSLGSPVIIVHVRSHSPDSGSFQFSRESAKVNGRPSFMAKRERQLRSSRFTPFVESVCRNQAAPFCESLPERRCFNLTARTVSRPPEKRANYFVNSRPKSRANSRGFADPFQRFKKSWIELRHLVF